MLYAHGNGLPCPGKCARLEEGSTGESCEQPEKKLCRGLIRTGALKLICGQEDLAKENCKLCPYEFSQRPLGFCKGKKEVVAASIDFFPAGNRVPPDCRRKQCAGPFYLHLVLANG